MEREKTYFINLYTGNFKVASIGEVDDIVNVVFDGKSIGICKVQEKHLQKKELFVEELVANINSKTKASNYKAEQNEEGFIVSTKDNESIKEYTEILIQNIDDTKQPTIIEPKYSTVSVTINPPKFKDLSFAFTGLSTTTGELNLAVSGKCIFDTCRKDCSPIIEQEAPILFKLCMQLASDYVLPMYASFKKK